MRQALWLLVLVTSLVAGRAALAQQTWVQIEAHSTLSEAEQRARAYSGAFPNVEGFAMSTGWYAVVLGPYSADEAGAALTRLKSDRLIPDDSYVTDGSRFAQRYWPVGAAGAVTPAPAPEATAATGTETVAAAPAPVAELEETVSQARSSEALLTRDERMLLQIALQWSGHYEGAIDGAIGPGTRRSMAEWQAATGHEATGVMTSRQRAEVIDAYKSEQAALGFTDVNEIEAGIEISLPMGLVDFDRYDPPFAHYGQKDGTGFEVFLISQPGDQNSLFALYELMQTLTIVPLDGPREINRTRFTISGANAKLQSYTQAQLDGGLIKGFTLVWSPADADRAARVLQTMQSSFKPVGTQALDDSLGQPLAEPRENLVSGIEVRRPVLSRSGFYIDGTGTVLTTAEVLDQCGRITLDGTHEADVAYQNADLGIAILKPRETLAPMSHAAFRTGLPRLNSEVAVAGYSYGDALTQPVMTFGTLEDVKGLDGQDDFARLALRALPGDAGGPVFDMSGSVVGMLLPRENGQGRVLPEDVGYALETDAIEPTLTAQGIAPAPTDRSGALAPEDLTRLAQGMTVLVSCWN